VPDVYARTVAAQPTAVVPAATTWDAYPHLWRALLGEVWDAVRAEPSSRPGRNVMLYLDDVPHVEVGVEVDGPFRPAGRVVVSELPAGRVLTARAETIAELDAAYRAIAAVEAERLGPRWEVYGHQRGDAPFTVDVYYLVR
jgi:hypothetical protein